MGYHDFDPWARAADNIAAGMMQVAQARARRQMYEQEQAAMAPVRRAQTENYLAGADYDRARTERERYKLTRQKEQDWQDIADAQEVESGARLNPDGTFSFTEPALKAFSRALLRKSRDASDLGGGLENFVQGANYMVNEREKRKNQRVINRQTNQTRIQMNEADNAAALERAKLPPTSTPAAQLERIRYVRGYTQGLKNKLTDLEVQLESNISNREKRKIQELIPLYKKRLEEAEKELFSLTSPPPPAPNPAPTASPTPVVPVFRITRGPDGKLAIEQPAQKP